MNTKTVPVIIALTGCALSCVISIIQGVDFGVFTTRLLLATLIFLALGVVIRVVLDRVTSSMGGSDMIDFDAFAGKVDTEDSFEE